MRPLPGRGGVGGISADRPDLPLREPMVEDRARSPARPASARAGDDDADRADVVEPLRTRLDSGAAKATADGVRGAEDA